MELLRFKTEGNLYAYDVNTNHILRVAKPIWLRLRAEASSLRAYADSGDPEAIDTVQTIQDLREKHGVFPVNLPLRRLEFPVTMDDVVKQLSTELQHIVLNVTEQCNFRCLYCKYGGSYVQDRVHSNRQMEWDIARNAIDFFLARNESAACARFGFYGGEPLIAFPLMRRIVDYTRSRTPNRPSFSVTTNGSLLTAERIKFLVRNDFSLIISLDGPEEIHDRYRKTARNDPTFSRVLKKIELIRAIDNDYYSRRVGFSVVLCPPYDLRAIIDFFADESIFTHGPIMFSHVDPFDTIFLDRFDKNLIVKAHRRQVAELREEFLYSLCDASAVNGFDRRLKVLRDLFAKRYARLHYRTIFPLGESCYPNGICTPGLRRLFVTVDGRLGLCEKMEERWIIGDIFNGFYRDAIENLINSYVRISTELCTKCWAVRICDSCYLHAVKNKELSIQRKREFCRIRKRDFAEALIEYCRVMERNPHGFDWIKMEGES